jgi:hypothetical protein
MQETLHDGGVITHRRLRVIWLLGTTVTFAGAGCHSVPTTIPLPVAAIAPPAQEEMIIPTADTGAWPPPLEPAVDLARPWTELTAIWFYYRRAELTVSESDRIAGIVRYAAEHPDCEIGINRPDDRSGAEPVNESVSRQRVAAIRDALVAAGVSPLRIHAGAFAGAPASLNRLVVVLVRDGP